MDGRDDFAGNLTYWVNWIKDNGLTAPAIMFLEVSKPFGFMGSQALLLAQPALDVFAPPGFTSGVIGLLEDRKGLEKLISCLEATETMEETEVR